MCAALAIVLMNIHSLTRRSGFRIAVLFAGLFALAVALILTVLYLAISNDLTTRLKSHVDELRATFVDVDKSGSFDELTRLISNYAVDAEPEENVFLLTDEANAYVAGNIRALQSFEGWRTIPWQELDLTGTWNSARTSTSVVGRWTDVKGGHVFVAGGNSDIVEVERILIDGLGLALLMTVAAAILGGVILGRRAQLRIGAMETALDAVARGELASRVPRGASGDDLDHVGEMINDTLGRLQVLIGSVKQVTADIAHDLKSPIGRVLQKLDFANDPATGLETYRETVDSAGTELRNVITTFEALLRIAEIEGGARKSRFTMIDLKAVLVNTVEILETVAEEGGHRIENNLEAAAPAFIRGDKELLTQLFVNVIENAIRHCPAGSVIRIDLTRNGDGQTVTVADNGPGIPPSEHDKVFRRLYRLEKSRTTPGSGLGLSLVAAIADLHEASVSLSQNNPGLAVSVRFNPV